MTVPGLTRLPTLMRRKPMRPLKGARMMVSSTLARAAMTFASFDLLVASSVSSCDCDSACVLKSSRLRLSCALLSASDGFGRGELRAGLDAVELDEHRALLHELAFGEMNGRDGVHRLRSDFGRLVRDRVADGFDFETELADRRFRRDDADRLILRTAAETAGATGPPGRPPPGPPGLRAHRRLAAGAAARGATAAVRATRERSEHAQHRQCKPPGHGARDAGRRCRRRTDSDSGIVSAAKGLHRVPRMGIRAQFGRQTGAGQEKCHQSHVHSMSFAGGDHVAARALMRCAMPHKEAISGRAHHARTGWRATSTSGS